MEVRDSNFDAAIIAPASLDSVLTEMVNCAPFGTVSNEYQRLEPSSAEAENHER